MAKKAKKTQSKKRSASKSPASKTPRASAAKKTPRKTAKKKTTKKTSKAAVTKKAASKARRKTAGKKESVRKTAPRVSSQKKTDQKTAKKTAKKTATKTSAPKADAPAKKTSKKTTPKAAPEPKADSSQTSDAKGNRKNITVADKGPGRRGKPNKPAPIPFPTNIGLLGEGLPKRKPLIPSGPKNVPAAQADGDDRPVLKKSPYNKRELTRFREILLGKRAELVGDISGIETEALAGGSGGLSNTPQHMAEQGSDAYDQSLSLDLAAADRTLLREIDAALARIEAGTYGLCEISGKPIRPERLEEIPWARYSIEAARERERHHPRR